MRLIIWGTGRLYQKYRDFLVGFDIVRLCDSNTDKQGSICDGVEIIMPTQIRAYDFDKLVIMTYAASEVQRQAQDLGISEDKIIWYSQLWNLKRPQICSQDGHISVYPEDWIIQNPKCILIISHNFSYTGVPMALKNMGCILRRMGYAVLMAAMDGGAFEKELRREKLDYISNLEMGFQTQYFEEILKRFQAVVIGSLILYRLAPVIRRIETPVIWWVHESHEKYYEGKEGLPQRRGLKYFAVGSRACRIFRDHYQTVDVQKLLYCIPDTCPHSVKEEKSSLMTIAAIGTVDERKAQDILLEAVGRMPQEYQERLKVVLVGRLDETDAVFVQKIKGLKSSVRNLEWIQELDQTQMDALYRHIDILVCPSRDDPMPIVVTEAMMHEKTCVISENVGQSQYIEHGKNGFVIQNEDVETLMTILLWLQDNRTSCTEIGKRSRRIYDMEFSESVMEKRLDMVLEELCGMEKR